MPDGSFTSPEPLVGFGADLDDDSQSGADVSGAEQTPERLAELRNLTSYQNLLRALPATIADSTSVLVWSNELEAAPVDQAFPPTPVQQRARNADEFRNRSQVLSQNSIVGNNAGNGFNGVDGLRLEPGPIVAPVVGILMPIVSGNELILARQARDDGQTSIQGAWLDWPELRRELLAQVGNLLPAARLEIAKADPGSGDEGRRLALLPIRLDPETTVVEPPAGGSPVRMSLIFAWGAMFLAAAAVAALLAGVVTLSERRADFVSAVTHELRTPLTTFRMYAEMLASGMVTDETQRTQYLETLRIEADRLTHLVENVLAYARLERGGLGNRIQTVTGEELLSAATQRLAERAAQADFALKTDIDAGASEARIRADPSAVEQILFNLVDNACKYAATARDRTLHLRATVTEGEFVVRLTDRGPGFSAEQRRRVFQPFRKSATEAAQSAPGVGLGLSLSRRLARDMGGDLRLDPLSSEGATMELTLHLDR